MVSRFNVASPAASPNLMGGALKLGHAGSSQPAFARDMGAASKAAMEAASCLSERSTTSARRQQHVSSSATTSKKPSGYHACATRGTYQNVTIAPTPNMSMQTLLTVTVASANSGSVVDSQKTPEMTTFGVRGECDGETAMDMPKVAMNSYRSAGGLALDGPLGGAEWSSCQEQAPSGSAQFITHAGDLAATSREVNEETLAKRVPSLPLSSSQEAAPAMGSNVDGKLLHAVTLDKRGSDDATREHGDMKLVQPLPKETSNPDATGCSNPGWTSGPTAPAVPDSQNHPVPQTSTDALARPRTIEALLGDNQPESVIPIVPVALLHVAEDGEKAPAAGNQVAAANLPNGGQGTPVKPSGYMTDHRDEAKAGAAPGANGKEAAKSASRSTVGFGPNFVQAAGKAGSKDITSGAASSDEQIKHGTETRAQVAPDQTNVSVMSDSAIPFARTDAGVFAPATTPTGGTSAYPSTKEPDGSPSLSSGASPQAALGINTAKLIHAMGQSEMRVGMSSAEFGNISISTLATRVMTSAVISLDHSELAKVIATHLPEMQAKLGAVLTTTVRIDTNSAGPSQSSGTFGGASQGSGDGSSGDNRHAGRTHSSHPDDRISRSLHGAVTVFPTRADGRDNSCLDIMI